MDSIPFLLKLVKYGLGNANELYIPNHTNWGEIFTLAHRHGVGAIALDGLQQCYDKSVPVDIDTLTKFNWIGAVKHQESEYGRQENVIASLAQFYQKHGIKMMVLKGWGLSLNYPIPSHRPCSDLDIYLYGEQEKGDKLVETELGVKVDKGHHHHTVFVYKKLTVENHYDFLNIYSHRSTKKFEELLKKICGAEIKPVSLQGVEVFLPPVQFNALFVLRHMAVEFAATGMNLRQVIDWGLFVKTYHAEVNWDEFLSVVKEQNMHHFLGAVNYICYTYLGFDKCLFDSYYDESYGEQVLSDLFAPNNNPKVKGFFKYMAARSQNWWRNRWKHKIVYSDSLLSTFIYQVMAHLMKPATLFH